jgi:hypothetical protein
MSVNAHGERLAGRDGWDVGNGVGSEHRAQGFPAWDEPGWLELVDEAGDGATKQSVVRAWAQKAGGEALPDGIRLPPNLPHHAHYRDLVSAARRLQLRVEEGGR